MQGYVAAVFAAILFAASGGAESAAQPSSPYAIDVSVLTGPQGGELTIDVDAAAGSAGAQSFDHVHVSLRSAVADDKILNLKDVPAPNGVATIDLGPLERGAAVGVKVQVRGEQSPRTVILRGDATARLRPDLVVTAVHAPPQTLTTRPVDVVADVDELNGETGAKATLTLTLGPTPLAEPKTVTVGAGGATSVTFEGVKLETAMSTELTVRVDGAAPYETDATNNSRKRRIEVTEHELVRANVLVPSLGGYGAQFNQHVYASITPKPPGSMTDLEAKVKELEPQLVRIFFHEIQERDPDQLASFYKTVELAHQSGAAINITYHTAVERQASARPLHGRVRSDPRRPRAHARLHERPLGHRPERGEHNSRDAGAVQRALPFARRTSPYAWTARSHRSDGRRPGGEQLRFRARTTGSGSTTWPRT